MSRSLIPILVLALGLSACGKPREPAPAEPGHAHAAGDGFAKGPHGGRLLVSGDFALEVRIFEDGVPPQFRLYPTLKGRPVLPGEVQASVVLARVDGTPGGQRDTHAFTAKDDYLLGSMEVHEPHSFDVEVRATHAGHNHAWTFASHEGRVEIAPQMATAAGVQVAAAAPGTIRETLLLYGTIRPDAHAQRDVAARFPGVVRTVEVQVGDRVKAGQRLATVESNESLQVYPIGAPIAGVVTQRHANPGEATDADALFQIADFSRVWAELSVFPRDRARLSQGQAVEVMAADGAARGSGRIGHVSPLGSPNQALIARVELDNGAGQWTQGQFVDARVAVAETPAALVVPLSALQRFRDWDVVFVSEGDVYQAQPVTLGRRDASHVEVTAGLKPGARVVIAESFLVKADIEKSGASHDH
ncbi:MAG: putative cation efflux system protein [Panacagrimonas sp.]|jgi:cobalt-zinc-cadmium efflux system membrane fusion protein|nr:efflux RND transporter periplasmic adaptor subunit [Panacagrimonas sp.]MCC2655779.1 putative cation efflux system protein [Panacagrimonas sp.]